MRATDEQLEGQLDWDITPVAHAFYSLVAQKMSRISMAGEFIDNAFDAAAGGITFEWGPATSGGAAYLVISDDGNGVKDMSALVTLGKRSEYSSTRGGRYGVGGTEALLWAGGASSTVVIETVRDGLHRRVTISWSQLTESKSWKIKPAFRERPARPGERGTTITITPYIHRIPDIEAMAGELGYLYWPGLAVDGRTIRLRTKAKGDVSVRAWAPPVEMTDRVEREFDVCGHPVKLVAGIVPEGVANPKNGLTYTSYWRVIESAGSLGCGSFDTSKICGTVHLGKGWKLSKHKDAIIRSRDELSDAVLAHLKPILEKAESLAQTLENAAFVGGVEAMVNRMLSPDKKAVREHGDVPENPGTKVPTGKGKKHRRARHEQDGATFAGRRGEAIRVSFVNWSDQPDSIGKFDGKNSITINQHNPTIAFAKAEGNRLAVAVAASALLAGHQALEVSDGRQMVLRGIKDLPGPVYGNFQKMLGSILAKPLVLDGRNLLESQRPTTTQPGGQT